MKSLALSVFVISLLISLELQATNCTGISYAALPNCGRTSSYLSNSIAFSPDGLCLAIGTDNGLGAGCVAIFQVAANGTLLGGTSYGSGTSPISIAFSPGGSYLATANKGSSDVTVFIASNCLPIGTSTTTGTGTGTSTSGTYTGTSAGTNAANSLPCFITSLF